jgi:predicted transcriptional regulator
MEILYQRGKATVSEVQEALPDRVGYSGVRALMSVLERKGHVSHTVDGQKFVYEPAEPAIEVAGSALDHVLSVFFGGSVERVVAALLSSKERKLSPEEAARLEAMIEEAKKQAEE